MNYFFNFEKEKFKHEIYIYTIDSTFNYQEKKYVIEGKYNYTAVCKGAFSAEKYTPQDTAEWPIDARNQIRLTDNNTFTANLSKNQLTFAGSDISIYKDKYLCKPMLLELNNTEWNLGRTYDYFRPPTYPYLDSDSITIYFMNGIIKYEIIRFMVKDSTNQRYNESYIAEGTYIHTPPVIKYNFQKFIPEDTTTWDKYNLEEIHLLKGGITYDWHRSMSLEAIGSNDIIFPFGLIEK